MESPFNLQTLKYRDCVLCGGEVRPILKVVNDTPIGPVGQCTYIDGQYCIDCGLRYHSRPER